MIFENQRSRLKEAFKKKYMPLNSCPKMTHVIKLNNFDRSVGYWVLAPLCEAGDEA